MVSFVILCGGSGSRLWPKSRAKLPKQLLKLTNEFSMFQNTVSRIYKMMSNNENYQVDKLKIICNIEHSHIIENQINEFNKTNSIHNTISYQIISEPKGRDSAAAICIASLLGDGLDDTFVLPCDHIFDDDEFLNCYNNCKKYLENSIITFGIKPTRVETGYGYIKIDNMHDNNTIQFVEKPDYDTAKQYFDDGNYLWNAGIFAFKNKNMITCFKKYADDIYRNCTETIQNTDLTSTKCIITLSGLPFINCRAISVDYAIMEKICCDCEIDVLKKTILYNSKWNDIGSYLSLYDELDKDINNNVLRGDILTINTNNCYIDSDNCLTAAVGLNNLIVVNTDDALLVCDSKNSQDVKKIVDKLKELNREEHLLHKIVFRPWGWYKNIEGNDNNGFKVKLITVYPGKRLSLQSHNFRTEHWVIVKGNAKVELDYKEYFLNCDESIYIPLKSVHRIENVGNINLEFTETQIGSYLGEDDIIRYQDDFGRV
uniref:mannose-1-phosphate guanylyltransferase n=1 Tax=viral metagenome TaxID=1070528 RepID=A0A6C0JFL8_9ZZZZ